MSTLQLVRAGNGKIIRSASGRPYGRNVTLAVTKFGNGALRRMPFAISRDLQPAAVAGKELYFRVTHNDLRTVANGGLVQTGFDFQFETLTSAVIPYIIKSYDAVAGTLFGIFTNNLAGSAAATRGYLYFNNPAWTTSRENALLTLPNCNNCLFLPSGIDHSDNGLNFSGDLPTSDKVIVNPGALLNGSTDYIWRAFLGTPINHFLISVFCQDKDVNSDNALWAFGLEAGNTVIFLRRLFGAAAGATGGETNAWRFGWVTTEPGAAATTACAYETANNTSGTNLQHVVIRRFVDGTDPEIYLDGVLTPLAFKNSGLPLNAALKGPIATAGQRLLIGRGSTATRFWHGYMDCFKFFSGSTRTATWALSEYTNLLDIDGSVIFGDPETVSIATMFGETIDITCNGLTNVTFQADKYVVNDTPFTGSAPGTPVIQTITQPAGGTIAAVTGNQVRYTNSSNTDPDDGGAVRMSNGSGTVLIPIRATIIPVTPPPPGGFYKTPNIAGKTAVSVGSLGAATTPNTLLWAFAQFNAGTFNTSTHYIKVTGTITNSPKGKDILVTAGGTQTHPLVIMSVAPAGADNWTSRAAMKVVDCCIRIQRPWVWLYGLWLELLPHGTAAATTWNTTGLDFATVNIEADNAFITACRMSTHRGVHQNLGVASSGLILSYNWFEIAAQADASVGNGDGGIFAEGSPACMTNITAVYNRFTDHSASLTNLSPNFRCFILSNGQKASPSYYSTNSEFAFNFMDCTYSHCMEFKVLVKSVHHNHGTGAAQPAGIGAVRPAGINTRGNNANADGFPFRPVQNNNRIHCSHWEMNGRNWDYANNWIVNSAGVIKGEFQLTPFGAFPAGNPIGGSDGARMMGNKGGVVLGDTSFEPQNYTYENLGSRGTVLIGGHQGGNFVDGAGAAITFTGFPPSGHPSGTHPHLINAQITQQTAMAGYTLQTPPVLSATICGPNDGNGTGKVWGT